MSSEDAVLLLTEAAAHVIPCPDGDPTTSGWMNPQNRRDSRTCILTASRGLVTIAPAGLEAFDRAVALLEQEPAIKEAWDPNEIGSVIASAVSAAACTDDIPNTIETWLAMLRHSGGSIVAFPVANVTWGEISMSLGDLHGELVALGDLNETFVKRLRGEASRFFQEPMVDHWVEELAERYKETPPPVIFLARVKEKGTRSIDEGLKKFGTLVDLALLFMKHAPPELCRTCASANRPGPRGLALDRRAMEAKLGGNTSPELGAHVLSLSLPRFLDQSHWNDAEPLPLGAILHTKPVGSLVADYLYNEGPIGDRIRIAARWFAEAHWAPDIRDAALALGISLEALVGSLTPLGGAKLAERYSVMEPDDTLRNDRAREFRSVWKVRSKIAHGARNPSLDTAMLERMESATFWAAQRLDSIRAAFAPTNEGELDQVFDGLISGTLKWSAP